MGSNLFAKINDDLVRKYTSYIAFSKMSAFQQ